MKTTAALPAFAVFAAAAALFWASTGTTEPTPAGALIEACETTLAARLKDPATYKRIRADDPIASPASWETYQQLDNPRQREYWRSLENGDARERKLATELRAIYDRMQRPTEWLLVLDYEASNAFGVPLRKTATCSTIVDGDLTLQNLRQRDTRVDGLTAFDWSIYRPGQ